jgi:hypothetical protein
LYCFEFTDGSTFVAVYTGAGKSGVNCGVRGTSVLYTTIQRYAGTVILSDIQTGLFGIHKDYRLINNIKAVDHPSAILFHSFLSQTGKFSAYIFINLAHLPITNRKEYELVL